MEQIARKTAPDWKAQKDLSKNKKTSQNLSFKEVSQPANQFSETSLGPAWEAVGGPAERVLSKFKAGTGLGAIL